MDLFNTNPLTNLLPYEGLVQYYGPIITHKEANSYFERLMQNTAWENDQAVIMGKLFITKRKVAWYGDEKYTYRYSNTTKYALPWTQELLTLKKTVEQKTGETFNSCLANLYHDGSEGMAWHSDGEKDLKDNGAIASMSFGAERKFSFKHKRTKQRIDVVLEKGSLLMMMEDTQKNWLHRLPPTKKVHTPRINLTFRTIVSR